jgi:hypothetical protein
LKIFLLADAFHQSLGYDSNRKFFNQEVELPWTVALLSKNKCYSTLNNSTESHPPSVLLPMLIFILNSPPLRLKVSVRCFQVMQGMIDLEKIFVPTGWFMGEL